MVNTTATHLRVNHMLTPRECCRDAWAKHKDLDSFQAKIMYVEALLKVYTTLLPPILWLKAAWAGFKEVLGQDHRHGLRARAGSVYYRSFGFGSEW